MWALAGPASFVIVLNLIILILTLKAASNKMQKHDVYVTNNKDRNVSISEFRNKITWLKGFSFLIILLGITWGTFVFYIHEFGSIFSWFFIVLNGLQVIIQLIN